MGKRKAEQTEQRATRETRDIPLELIIRDTKNHRMDSEAARKAIEELATSMRHHGQQVPVLVWDQDVTGGGLNLVYGFRRVAAAELLGWKTIRSEVIEDCTPADVQRLRTIENLDRADLNPVEEALAISELLTAVGHDCDPEMAIERVAAMLGRSPGWVRDRSYLMRLSPKCQEMIAEGKLLLGHARAIARVADLDAQDQLAEWSKVGDDGTCHQRLDHLHTLVSQRMNSLKIAAWKLELPVAGKPACKTCSHNSSNDAHLFDDQGTHPEMYCMNPGCYEAKAAAAEKAIAKAVEKIVNKGSAPEKATDAWVKPQRVERAAAKAAGKPVEQEERPQEPRLSPEDEAKSAHNNAVALWITGAVDAIEKAILDDPMKFVGLAILDHIPDAAFDDEESWDDNRHRDWLDLALSRDEARLKELARVAARQNERAEKWQRNIPVLNGCVAEWVLEEMRSTWGLDIPAKPKMEDFQEADAASDSNAEASDEAETSEETPKQRKRASVRPAKKEHTVEILGDRIIIDEWEIEFSSPDRITGPDGSKAPGWTYELGEMESNIVEQNEKGLEWIRTAMGFVADARVNMRMALIREGSMLCLYTCDLVKAQAAADVAACEKDTAAKRGRKAVKP